MYNTYDENLSTHTLECAFLTNFLCNIGNVYYNKNYDTNKLTTYSLYHDVTEIITGDMPTPIKYYNKEIKTTYKKIENEATKKLLSLLPKELYECYEPQLTIEVSQDEYKIIKIADTLCAYIKCKKEISLGNNEFKSAKKSIENKLNEFKSDELKHFMDFYISTFDLTLDDI